jgi:hypothetical protein
MSLTAGLKSILFHTRHFQLQNIDTLTPIRIICVVKPILIVCFSIFKQFTETIPPIAAKRIRRFKKNIGHFVYHFILYITYLTLTKAIF